VTVPVSDVPAGAPLAVRVNDQLTLAVCQVEGKYHAVDSKCPHRGAQLAEGELAGGLLICPLHHFKFNLKNGRCLLPVHLKLRSFPVAVEDDQLKIEVPLEVQQDAARPV
jgi:nitrite reductase/ring-hydroxylating ferredoxin subunit